jgi:hypothetical protein
MYLTAEDKEFRYTFFCNILTKLEEDLSFIAKLSVEPSHFSSLRA